MLKKLRKNDYNWTGKYIKEYNQMVSYYEKQLEEKNRIIESLRIENENLRKNIKFQGKQKQISDNDIEQIRQLKNEGKSYSYISNVTGWSKATISRVINNKKNIY
ncbi:helix-turn-helix domain-containing protein [Romboutsia timonensis]|uniref:helix-turn-helix domain-containing protein n=1 Tax=Romboutsia timonensis TaxID=1776391 RepID=UPI002A8178E7|nr:helix-turn-helix domain-containing protein [Romboutsia timonensis]MDY3960157.1 helix-turn-helix domain-containing protein [Romboutsia timonensis]